MRDEEGVRLGLFGEGDAGVIRGDHVEFVGAAQLFSRPGQRLRGKQMRAEHRVKTVFHDVAMQGFGIMRVGQIHRRLAMRRADEISQMIDAAEELGRDGRHADVALADDAGGVLAPEGQRVQHLGGEIPTVQLLEQRAARCVVSSACIAGEDQRFQSKFTSLFDGVANQTDRGGMRLSTAIFIKCSHFHYKPKARRRKASGSEMSMFQVKTTGFRKRGHCSCVAPARIWAREILPETVLGRLST